MELKHGHQQTPLSRDSRLSSIPIQDKSSTSTGQPPSVLAKNGPVEDETRRRRWDRPHPEEINIQPIARQVWNPQSQRENKEDQGTHGEET